VVDVTGTAMVVVGARDVVDVVDVGATDVVVTLCTAGFVVGGLTGAWDVAAWLVRTVEIGFEDAWCVTVWWIFATVTDVVGVPVSTVIFDAGVVAPWFVSTTTSAIPTAMTPVEIQETNARRRSIRTPWLETASG